MGFVIAGFVALLVLCIAIGAHNARYGIGQKVKVQFRDSETGRTVHAGNGNSIGAAIADGFSKMWYSVSISSREDTIKSKLDSMNRTLSENRSRMRSGDIAQCEQYIGKMRGLLSQKQAERVRAEREKREVEQEKKRQQAERAAELERQRREKEKELSERQRYIAEQRRIMTASMRYDVMRRDNFRCVLCGAAAQDGVKLHVDHIRPVSKGGKTEISNLRTLCERCNLGKRDKIEVPNSEKIVSNGIDYVAELEKCRTISEIYDLWTAALKDKSVVIPEDDYDILANRIRIARDMEKTYGISQSATQEIKSVIRQAMPN